MRADGLDQGVGSGVEELGFWKYPGAFHEGFNGRCDERRRIKSDSTLVFGLSS